MKTVAARIFLSSLLRAGSRRVCPSIHSPSNYRILRVHYSKPERGGRGGGNKRLFAREAKELPTPSPPFSRSTYQRHRPRPLPNPRARRQSASSQSQSAEGGPGGKTLLCKEKLRLQVRRGKYLQTSGCGVVNYWNVACGHTMSAV